MVVKDDDSIDPEWTEVSQSGTVVLGGTLIEQLANVIVTDTALGDVLAFDFTTKTWINIPGSGVAAPVTSVFDRIGVVVAEEGDYILDQLGDVVITTPLDDQLLVYDAGNNRWINGFPDITAPVQSVFGRQGVVEASPGDYDAVEVDYDPTAASLIAVEVQGAIDELDIDVQANVTALDGKANTVHTHQPDDALAEPITTGRINGGILTGVSATTFQITAGAGVIVDSYTDYLDTLTTPVSWITETLNLLNPTTELVTYVSINSFGTVVLANVSPSPALERTNVVIGSLFHDPLQVDDPTPIQDYNQIGTIGHGLIDYWDFIGLVADGLGLEANIGVLTTKRLPGRIFSFGINEDVDPTSPNVISLPEADPFIFYYMVGDGDLPTGLLISVFDNLNFDPLGLGILQAVGAGGGGARTTIQWVFSLAPGIAIVLYGQTEYTDLTVALDQVLVDREGLVIPAELDQAFGPLFAIGMRQGATDMSLATDAFIVSFLDSAGGGGGGGSGGGGVITWKGRDGDVVPLAGDYTASEITNVPAGNIVATEVQAALDELDFDLSAVITAAVTELDDLTDVTIVAEAADEVIVNNGAGVFTNALLTGSQVVNTPAGLITSTNVQGAINELEVISATKPRMSVQALAPSNPVEGDLWWDTDDTDGVLYVYYVDTDSAQWVPTTPALSGTSPFQGVFSGAQVGLTGDIAPAGDVEIPWDLENYDVDDWFDIGQPTRLTVPADLGVTRIIVGGSVEIVTETTQLIISVKRNGLQEQWLPTMHTQSQDKEISSISSGAVPVVAGDYFEFNRIVNSGNTVTAANSNFWIYALA